MFSSKQNNWKEANSLFVFRKQKTGTHTLKNSVYLEICKLVTRRIVLEVRFRNPVSNLNLSVFVIMIHRKVVRNNLFLG